MVEEQNNESEQQPSFSHYRSLSHSMILDDDDNFQNRDESSPDGNREAEVAYVPISLVIST